MGRNGRLAAAATVCALTAGCEAQVERTTAAFVLTQVGSCSLRGLERLELIVAGDFPSRRSGLLPAGEALSLDALPIEARAVSIEARLAEGDAVALAPLPLPLPRAESGAPLALMPLDASCPLGDTLVAAPPGAAVAAPASGALLVAGGQADDGSSLRSVVVLPRGSELGGQIEGGLLLPRAFATATPIEDGVLIAGGGAGDEGPAHDTFEIYDEGAGRLLPPQVLAGGPRRNHGAARLPDGRVLLVGGVSEAGGAALPSAELIDPVTGTSRGLGSTLQKARIDPTVLVLDDGAVLVLLGRPGEAVGGQVVTLVERLGAEQDERYGRFDRVASLPAAHEVAAVAALEGGRVAWLGCSDVDDADVEDPGACELSLLVPRERDAEREAEDGELDWVRDVIAPATLEAAGVRALSSVRLAALHDGRLLVIGRAGATRAWLIELARGEVTPDVDATRVPDQLVELADGALAELDAFGASLRRHDAKSVFHDPPEALLSADELEPDRPARARFDADGVHARGGPLRLELPFLRFGKLRVELRLSGQGRVLLKPEHAGAVAVELDGQSASLGDCSVTRPDPDAPIVLERRGVELTLRVGDADRVCTRAALDGLLGLAFGLDDGARLHTLRVQRR